MSTTQELQQIKAALSRRPKGPGRRLSPELRLLVAAYVRRRFTQGATKAALTAELGIGSGTINRALQEKLPAQAMVPVRLVPESDGDLQVRTQGGLTISGLNIASLAELIRATS
jgi:hypothetical protein